MVGFSDSLGTRTTSAAQLDVGPKPSPLTPQGPIRAQASEAANLPVIPYFGTYIHRGEVEVLKGNKSAFGAPDGRRGLRGER